MLFYIILFKELEHLWILISWNQPLQILRDGCCYIFGESKVIGRFFTMWGLGLFKG